MSVLILEQMDYILFIYGLGFIILAAVCFAQNRAKSTVPHIPWHWLGLFGLLHGTREWLDLLAISVGSNWAHTAIHTFLVLTSFVCLVEFGRSSTLQVKGRAPGRWVIVALLAITLIGVASGRTGVNGASRYALVLAGGAWSTYALVLASRLAEPCGRRPLLWVACAVALYTVAAGIIVPKSDFLPAYFLNQESFLEMVGLPIQLIRGILAMCIAAGVWIYFQTTHRAEPDLSVRASRSKVATWAGLTVLVILVCGWVTTGVAGRYARNELYTYLKCHAMTAAAAINPEDITKLKGSEEDLPKPYYKLIRSQIKGMRAANEHSRFVYLMAVRDGKVIFLADSEPVDSKDYSAPGDKYDDATPELLDCFKTGIPFVEGPVRDYWGTWVSGIAAIRHPKTGKVIAILGIDEDSRNFSRNLFEHRLLAIIITLLLCVTSIGFFLILQSTQESRARAVASERRSRALVEGSPNCVALFDQHGRYVAINHNGLELMGRAEVDVIGKEFTDFWTEDIRPAVMEAMQTALQGKRATFEAEYTRPDGRPVSWNIVLNPILHSDDPTYRFVGICVDISQRKQAESDLRIQTTAIHAASDMIVITDTDGRIQFVNRAFEQETGYAAEEVLGENPRILKSGQQDQVFYKDLWQTILAGDTWQGEMTNRRKDGSLYTEDITITPVKGQNETLEHFIAIKRNITLKKAYQEQLDHLAHHDLLTGLPNRLLFSDRLTQSLAHAKRSGKFLAVMFLDLDRFKLINDTLGHNTGDMLLREVARRLTSILREADTISRMGGDEFTLIVNSLSSQQNAVKIARKVLESFSHPFYVQGQELYVTASIGISLYPADGADVETLVRNADTAMYRAKEQGRDNYHVYTESLNAAAFMRMTLENSLRRAIEREEFVLHYQPKVDINTGSILGAEALVRWQHPELGLVGPSQFIPLAEETGLIGPISEWVLRTACTQNKAWQDQGLPSVDIAVNMSARQFQQKGLKLMVRKVLKETGLDPKYLDLELTESMLMHNPDQAIQMLDRLKAMGVRISIDDFGTGYSSLSYLKKFPIDAVKIDQSFIRDITTNPDDAAIAGAVVAMAHSLKLKVIAEGVETLEQLEFLRSLNCDEMQGYFVSQPVPAEQFTELLQDVARKRTDPDRFAA